MKVSILSILLLYSTIAAATTAHSWVLYLLGFKILLKEREHAKTHDQIFYQLSDLNKIAKIPREHQGFLATKPPKKRAANPGWDSFIKKLTPDRLCKPKLAKFSESLFTFSERSCELRAVLTSPVERNKLILFLERLKQADAPIYHDAEIKLVHTLMYFENQQFAEALRNIHELVPKHPELTVLYQKIQKIFSRHQKGDGAVGLRQNF